jgi:hypothetical protein
VIPPCSRATGAIVQAQSSLGVGGATAGGIGAAGWPEQEGPLQGGGVGIGEDVGRAEPSPSRRRASSWRSRSSPWTYPPQCAARVEGANRPSARSARPHARAHRPNDRWDDRFDIISFGTAGDGWRGTSLETLSRGPDDSQGGPGFFNTNRSELPRPPTIVEPRPGAG